MVHETDDQNSTRRPEMGGAFRMERAMEFFSLKELSQQIGCGPDGWPLALLKELLDNALDACEAGGIAPVIEVTANERILIVADNSPGIPLDTVKGSLDYHVRVSDKAKRVAPTRGALGNALKCVWAAPFVLDGKRGLVEIATAAFTASVAVSLDQIRQVPRLELTESAPTVKTGTRVTVHWPEASYLGGDTLPDFYREAKGLLERYDEFSPHARFTLNGEGWREPVGLAKWAPSDKPDPAWYTPATLEELAAAYIGRGDGGLSLRDFLAAEFAGLAGTQARARVLQSASLSGATLDALALEGQMDHEAAKRLHAAMVAHTRRIKPERLGWIGTTLLNWSDSPRYKRITGMVGNLPFVVEVAVGIRPEGATRLVWCGLNFAPVEGIPFSVVDGALGAALIREQDPVAVTVHLVSPRVTFTDRGKRHADLHWEIARAIREAITSAAAHWTRKAKQMRRDEAASARMLREMIRQAPKPMTTKDAAYEVMERAYLKASDNGRLPALARMIMYAARPLIIGLTGNPDPWKHSATFTQGLLPDFMAEHPGLTASWDVVFDDRGHLIEPHSRKQIGIGGLAVRAYLAGWSDPDFGLNGFGIDLGIKTTGPTGRYGAVLFVEKEGYWELFSRVKLAERFDLAVMSTKGLSNTAARKLVAHFSAESIPVFVVHDFDKAGFLILDTLRRDTRRWKWKTTPLVTDFGLSLADALAMGLDSEAVIYKFNKDPRELLRQQGATEAECNFLVSGGRPGAWTGRRIELNAMGARQLIDWVESKLIAAGVRKVIPDGNQLQDAYRRAALLARAETAAQRILEDAESVEIPDQLDEQIRDLLSSDPALPWDGAIARLVREASV